MRSSFLIAALYFVYEIMMKWSRRKRKVTHAPENFPEDLLIEILTRLPPKSLMRFKCISKSWSSLLTSRYFCNRYLTAPSSTPQTRLYMSLIDHSKTDSLLLSSSPTTSLSSSLVFNQTIPEIGGYPMRVLRGFICFTLHDKKPRIYNPTTRQLVIFPDIASHLIAQEGRGSTLYFICHDSIHDQYKILCTISKLSSRLQKFRSEHWVYLVEAGGSWTRVAKEFPHHFLRKRGELTMEGVLYYLAWTDYSTGVLVSFDMSSEEFDMIQLPPCIPGSVLPIENWKRTQINYDGKVAIIDITDINVTGSVILWILKDWKKEEWLKKTLVFQPSQMHLLTAGNRYLPKSTTLKDKVILIPDTLIYPHYILCYDLLTNHLNKIDIIGIPKLDSVHYVDMEFMDVSESIVYLQT